MIEQAPTTTSSPPKPRIRHLTGTRYLVESFTRPGLGHQVDVLRLRCGCEAGSYNRRCRHLVLAIEYDAWRKHEEAKARDAHKASREQAPVQAANWTSAPAAAQAQSEATQPAPMPAAAARPVTGERGMRALEAAFE